MMTNDTEFKARAVEEWLQGSQDWIISELKRIIQAPPFDPDRIQQEVEGIGVQVELIEFTPDRQIKFDLLVTRDDETIEIQVKAVMMDVVKGEDYLSITKMHLNRSIRF